MSFENIQLPDFLLADLYKDCLVELENVKGSQSIPAPAITVEVATKETVTTKPNLRYLGENKKNVAIIVNDSNSAFLNDNDLQFLTNVLKACQLNLGDIAIINTNQQVVDHVQLKEELSTKTALLFNVEPGAIQLPFSIPDFQPQAFAGTNYMKAPALNTINDPSQDGKVLKSKLWLNLQKIFGI